jgi:formate C-acetyltransferase
VRTIEKAEKMKTDTFKQDYSYLLDKFRNPVFDQKTGMDNETLKANLMALAEEFNDQPHEIIKAKAFAYVCENVRIDVNSRDWFVAFGCWDRKDRPLSKLISKWDKEVNANYLKLGKLIEEQKVSGASNLVKDFDHSVPDWEAIFEFGFPGLLERVRKFRTEHEKKASLSKETKAYFDGLEITYSAILDMLKRFHRHALDNANGNQRILAVAECLNTLIHGAPTNTYEVLQLIYLFFIFGEHIDRFQVRSLGNLDRTIYPYFQRDLDEKRYTERDIREFFRYFLMQWASIDNYWGHPFYFGGTKANGESEINELSFLILDVYDQLDIGTPKLQLKVSENTPVEFLNKALAMIRNGHNSIVFVSEASIERALMGIGIPQRETRTCDILGCYEFAPKGRGCQTMPGCVNMLKPIEQVFNNGVDPQTGIKCGVETGELSEIKTFDLFYLAYIHQLDNTIENVIKCVDDFEQYLSFINPAQVYSASIENSLKTARDAFHNGSVYNITSIWMAGLATTVDALMAVKEFVFDKEELTLTGFRDILNANWEGHEKLRLKALHCKNKFGNGIDSVDLYADAIARYFANKINMRPNSRNGFYVASAHPARQFIILGERTGATPDGRFAGEEMSKNLSPTMGMDINGVTALVKSVTRIDSAMFPGDFTLDVMMHPSTVQGKEGLAAMRVLLKTYMNKHGIAIHFNIFDPNVLIDAQKHPDKYEGLQVRVCGWNVRFNDIAKKEQDQYIKRALNIAE